MSRARILHELPAEDRAALERIVTRAGYPALDDAPVPALWDLLEVYAVRSRATRYQESGLPNDAALKVALQDLRIQRRTYEQRLRRAWERSTSRDTLLRLQDVLYVRPEDGRHGKRT